jgi:heat shock protein HslJ
MAQEANVRSRSASLSLLVAGLLMLTAVCATAQSTSARHAPGDEGLLESVKWVLVSYGGTQALAKAEVTAEFAGGQITGSGGVNRYFGTYQIAGDALTISGLGSTKMAGPPEMMLQESTFFGLLEKVAKFTVGGRQLQLIDAAGQPALKFEAISTGDSALQPITPDVPPFTANGRVMVPLRAIIDWLGAGVQYDPAARRVAIERASGRVELTIGSSTATVGGRSVTLEAPAMEVSGRTFVPLRFVGEALGVEVGWDAAAHTAILKEPGRKGLLSVPWPKS